MIEYDFKLAADIAERAEKILLELHEAAKYFLERDDSGVQIMYSLESALTSLLAEIDANRVPLGIAYSQTEEEISEMVRGAMSKLTPHQRKIFEAMLTQRNGGTFQFLRDVKGGWQEIAGGPGDDAINRQLKQIRQRLGAKDFQFEISEANHNFKWIKRADRER